MSGQVRPAAAARPTYLVTTPLDKPSDAAICSCESLASSFRRKTSLILRIVIDWAGMLTPEKKAAREPARLPICATPSHRGITSFRYRDRPFRYRDRRFRQVRKFGHVRPE